MCNENRFIELFTMRQTDKKKNSLSQFCPCGERQRQAGCKLKGNVSKINYAHKERKKKKPRFRGLQIDIHKSESSS